MRRTTAHGIAFIAREESFRPRRYPDPLGYDTIAFGHLWRAGDPEAVTVEEGRELLAHDLATAESWVNGCVRAALRACEFDALVDFAFNEGGGALRGSRLLLLLNAGDRQAAADELPRWTKGVDARTGARVTLPVLIGRRARERALFLGPEYPDAPAPAEAPAHEAPPGLRPVAAIYVLPGPVRDAPPEPAASG